MLLDAIFGACSTAVTVASTVYDVVRLNKTKRHVSEQDAKVKVCGETVGYLVAKVDSLEAKLRENSETAAPEEE